MAETAAVGRALSDAGYGVQFADVGERQRSGAGGCGVSRTNAVSGSRDLSPMEESRFLPDSLATIARITMQGIRLQEIWCIREVRQNPAPARA